MSFRGTVLIADARPILRGGIRSSLEEAGFAVAGEAVDLRGAVAGLEATGADVCILCGRLHGSLDGAVRTLRHVAPPLVILVLSEAPNDEELLEAVRAGASGYLGMEVDVEQLPRAVAAVAAGEAVIPRRFVSRLLAELRDKPESPVPPLSFPELTKREREVVDMLYSGWSTARIAGHLFVAPVTIRTHVSAILSKLQLPDRAALLDLCRSKEVLPRQRVDAQSLMSLALGDLDKERTPVAPGVLSFAAQPVTESASE